MQQFEQLVFSGVQPTGNLQLGNYLGAIKRWVDLQNTYPCLFCVVDMHALTVNPDPDELLRHTREVASAYIAAGIDADKHIIFNQSRVYQHAELAWILNCIARIGWMNRMTQFKDKAGKDKEKVSLGLYAYPCLMAADILLYRATLVPVGEDQKQHIELTRDIAQKFNMDYREKIAALGVGKPIKVGDETISGFFPLPETLMAEESMRIMSLRDGTKKMSKSDPSDMSRINLSDTQDDIARKIRKAKTDAEPLPERLEELKYRPEASNLVAIYAALSDKSTQEVLTEFSGRLFSDFKPFLTDLAIAKLAPINAELRRLQDAPDYIDAILQAGGERAANLAEMTMRQVRDIVGFLRDQDEQ